MLGQNEEGDESERKNEFQMLITKRGACKGQVTRFLTFINKFKGSETKDYSQLETRLEKIEETWSNFEKIQTEIELLTEDQAQIDERELFEDSFFSVVAEAKSLINSKIEINQSLLSTQNTNTKLNVKLPNLSLPEFDGSYDKWFNFADTFHAVVDKNTDLAKVEKFYYLQRCLKGEAAQTIQAIKVTNENYDVAWEVLKKRFENKRAIVDKHIQLILDIPVMKQESHFTLRNFVDTLQSNIRSLQSLGQPVNMWDTLLIYLCVQKLDTVSKQKWKEIINKTEFPSIEQFVEFLTERSEILEGLDNNSTKIHKYDSRRSKFERASGTFAHLASVADTQIVTQKTISCDKYIVVFVRNHILIINVRNS